MAEVTKPIHTLVLDTGSIIKNEPSVSTLLGQSKTLVTVPAIISEIKDAATRARVETTLLPFLTIRSPSPGSVKFVTEFARRTGDLAVLSKPDIQIIALTYEIECERNNGDWRLRKMPGQKRVNGAPPAKQDPEQKESAAEGAEAVDSVAPDNAGENQVAHDTQDGQDGGVLLTQSAGSAPSADNAEPSTSQRPGILVDQAQDDTDVTVTAVEGTQQASLEQVEATMNELDLEHEAATETIRPTEDPTSRIDSAANSGVSQEDSDSEGWITPGNLKKRQTEDAGGSTEQTKEPKTMQVGVLTTDYAMQNMILQINLNLLSPSMTRVKHLKTFVLRCHACFCVSKDMTKQFCPRCGQPSLTRVSCSTNANGEFKLHLKKNMQWNTRGDRYSVPKPVHGSSNGRLKGGGKGGWGNELILAEDQKEFERASKTERRQKERSLMDEDYLPGILTGDRGRAGGRIKVGAGRNVNSKKR
ncbi:20S-pre-rRNA D-site endonuclease nob1 [Recurvomyces mirabilis]|uniref:20S-pre-rRNA D-site endonuclease NOB1 n=1 Tax=Recurvomyces mirabilis TaxID=574656 RepID=A0AAE0WWP1_9PEZI|nr:20S-pre-rRNA D-site endonuclease nob1 [Recurvomyces mirabilis]KAK5161803.1 20S-pre-rRNA D-site endonuclease nob1 [Recurvomyces mirabilis]